MQIKGKRPLELSVGEYVFESQHSHVKEELSSQRS